MYRKILLAYDGSEAGQRALLDCDEMAQMHKAEVFLVAVMPPAAALIGGEGFVYDARREEEDRRRYREVLDEGISRLAAKGHRTSGEVVVGEAVDEIARHARKIDADLIVVGHKHLDSWAARWWRGSISGALVEHSPCSVLCVITH